MIGNACYTSQLDPTSIADALTNEKWVLGMQKELRFNLNEIRSLRVSSEVISHEYHQHKVDIYK